MNQAEYWEMLKAKATEDSRRDRLAEDTAPRLTVDELRAKHGDWGKSDTAPPKPTWRAPDILTVAAEMRADPSRLQRLLNTDRQQARDAVRDESQSYGNEGS